jgi:hypothetical protein
MIIDVLLKFINGIFNFFVSILPDSDGFSTEITDNLTTLLEYPQAFNTFLPVEELYNVLAWFITFEISLLTVYALFFILKFIRGHG